MVHEEGLVPAVDSPLIQWLNGSVIAHALDIRKRRVVHPQIVEVLKLTLCNGLHLLQNCPLDLLRAWGRRQ